MKSREEDGDNLRDKIKFDRDALDDAIEEQAGLFLQASDAFALAASLRDEAKAEMEQEYAKACKRARDANERITEAAVKEAALLDTKYLRAEQKWRNLKLESDLAAGLRESFDSRGKMLKEMAQLFIAGYFQVSSVGGQKDEIKYARAAQVRKIQSQRRSERD